MPDRITKATTAVTVDAPALACDLTDAADTAEERIAEYDRLFTAALLGRERTARAVRLRFRADEGVRAWVADLAVREKACCPFYDFAVSAGGAGGAGGDEGTGDEGTGDEGAGDEGAGDEVWWDISLVDGVADDEQTARPLLDTYYHAPDYAAEGVAGMTRWLADNNVSVATDGSGMVMRFAPAADPAR